MTTLFLFIRTATYSAVFVGVLMVLLPGRLLQWSGVHRPEELGALGAAGIATGVAGAALVLWCLVAFALVGKGTAAPFDPPRRLVVVGPYRVVRNPIYVGAGLVLGAVALVYQSAIVAAYLAVMAVLIDALVRWYEEPVLRRTFGADYEAYCSRVRRWIPRFPR